MRRTWFWLPFLTLLSACVVQETEKDPHVVASGTDGRYSLGFAYDGSGVIPYEGAVYVDVNDTTNNGTVVAAGRLGNEWLNVSFTSIAGAQPFHDGGIVLDLVEHGDSGTGDSDVPRVDLLAAGWGQAKLNLQRGKTNLAIANPMTQEPEWAAHFMIVRNGFRDDQTNQVLNAARSGPYDPSRSGDAFTDPNDREIHLEIESGSAQAPVVYLRYATASNVNLVLPTSIQTQRILNPAFGARGEMWINLTQGLPQDVRFRLLSPSGQELQNITMDAIGTRGPLAFDVNEAGEYRVQVSGQGAALSYNVTLKFHARPVALLFWFEDVEFGDPAIQEGLRRGLISLEPSPSTSSPNPFPSNPSPSSPPPSNTP